MSELLLLSHSLSLIGSSHWNEVTNIFATLIVFVVVNVVVVVAVVGHYLVIYVRRCVISTNGLSELPTIKSLSSIFHATIFGNGSAPTDDTIPNPIECTHNCYCFGVVRVSALLPNNSLETRMHREWERIVWVFV